MARGMPSSRLTIWDTLLAFSFVRTKSCLTSQARSIKRPTASDLFNSAKEWMTPASGKDRGGSDKGLHPPYPGTRGWLRESSAWDRSAAKHQPGGYRPLSGVRNYPGSITGIWFLGNLPANLGNFHRAFGIGNLPIGKVLREQSQDTLLTPRQWFDQFKSGGKRIPFHSCRPNKKNQYGDYNRQFILCLSFSTTFSLPFGG